jgi:predicted MFS family arabinose efflux permease
MAEQISRRRFALRLRGAGRSRRALSAQRTNVYKRQMNSTIPAPIRYWPLVLAATATLLITMGIRQSLGLFVQPLTRETGLDIQTISFALAVGQFVWGAVQPAFGALADQKGSGRVLVAGALLLALGMALTPLFVSGTGLLLTLGVLSAAGAGAGSFSILIGSMASRLPPERRSMAAGVINAGGSFGQFLFAPFVQAVISFAGWAAAAWALAAAALTTLPLAWPLRRRAAETGATPGAASVGAAPDGITLRRQIAIAARDRSYWCLHIGFFTCGFHIAFLVTHLPTIIAMCGLAESVSAGSLALIGLFNVGGSLAMGWLGQRYRMKLLLALLYASRAVLIAVYLVSPQTATTFFVFSAALGATWLATVPPTAGLVGKLFGSRYLGTLFGLTLLSHQIGGFFGAWMGGLALVHFGSYTSMWYADIALALVAAVANLPIREAAPRLVAA